MSDYGMTLPRATRRPLPQGAYPENLRNRPNRTWDDDAICVVCAGNNVITKLSRYNPNRDTCWVHTEPDLDPLADRACPNCGEPSELIVSGECRCCAQYRRKNGRDRPPKVIHAWRANHAAA